MGNDAYTRSPVGAGREVESRLADLESRLIRTPVEPIGILKIWMAGTAPDGYLMVSGQTVSRTTYPKLFALWGTTFNTGGEASSDFRMPSMAGRVPVGFDSTQTEFNVIGKKGGAKTHTLTVAEMPSHNHSGQGTVQFLVNGGGGSDANISDVTGSRYKRVSYTTDTGGDGAHNNLQPYITVNFIVRAG